MITGHRYLLRGQIVTVLVAWNGKRNPDQKRLETANLLLCTGKTAPRNVMIRFPDGAVAVRPFRGLRRLPDPVETEAGS